MPRDTLVRDVMTTDVLTFHPEDKVQSAAEAMAQRSIGGAPVIDGDSRVVGLVTDDDLIVQEARMHFPTVISVSLLELVSIFSASRRMVFFALRSMSPVFVSMVIFLFLLSMRM